MARSFLRYVARLRRQFSSKHFASERLVDDIREALAANDLSGSSLKIEITEIVLMTNVTETTKTMADVERSGSSLTSTISARAIRL